MEGIARRTKSSGVKRGVDWPGVEFGESLGMLEGVEAFRKRPFGSLGSSFGGILKCLERLCVEGQNIRLRFAFLNWKCRDYARHVQDGGEKVF